MNTQQLTPPQLLAFIACTVLILSVLTSCGASDSGTVLQVATVIPQPTVTYSGSMPTAYPTQVESRHAYDTRVAQTRAQWATEIAQIPTWTPGSPPPTETPEPTPTLIMGFHGCANANTHIPQQFDCWRGIVNGELLSIAAGREGNFGDPTQGLFMINHGPYFDPTDPTTELYPTPLKLGGMQIVSIDGTRFTLAPHDPRTTRTPPVNQTPTVTLIFDLSTRQWVSETPLPTPSLSTSPLPTMSPSLLPIPSISPLP